MKPCRITDEATLADVAARVLRNGVVPLEWRGSI